MARRNNRPPADAPAVVPAAMRPLARAGPAPFGLFAAVRALWAWAWENKAVSAILVSAAVVYAVVLLQPSDATLVARALSSQVRISPPVVTRLIERPEMSAIVLAIEQGGEFVIVDGGNRVGKSVAVRVAASRLSASRTVRWSVCDEGSTAVGVLRGLFGLDTTSTSFLRVLTSVAKLSPPAPSASIADLRGLVLASDASRREPVLVVEMAERLSVRELKALVDFAKELVDERRGRFVFVFSPTDKLNAIGKFGSVSRAQIIHVGSLGHAESMEFLTDAGCDVGRAAALDALVGGHLPHLVSHAVREYCRGALPLAEVENTLLADVGAEVRGADGVLGKGSVCNGLCSVVAEEYPSPEVLDMLLKSHLVVAALKRGIVVESRLVRAWVNATCVCEK
jgi:hypothetical protein